MRNDDRDRAGKIAEVKEFLRGYRLCAEMLSLSRYENKRTEPTEDVALLAAGLPTGNEAIWRAQMYEVEHLIGYLRNSREKLVLYWHYIRGESIERTADLLGISRRTGYRLHHRGLTVAGSIFARMKKTEISFSELE